MINYYFDNTGELKPYTFQAKATENTMPPDNATRIEPKFKDGYIPCFINGAWVLKANNKGQTAYNTETKEQVTVDYYGDLKEGHTLLEPISYGKWDQSLGAWIVDENEKQLALITNNKHIINALTKEATLNIDTLQDAIDLAMADDDDKAQLNAWKRYRILLSRVDISKTEMILPDKPEQ